MKVYQCTRCGLVFKTKKQIIAHLRYVEKINNLAIDYFYQAFNLNIKDAEKVV
jgi:hypothetical protein